MEHTRIGLQYKRRGSRFVSVCVETSVYAIQTHDNEISHTQKAAVVIAILLGSAMCVGRFQREDHKNSI